MSDIEFLDAAEVERRGYVLPDVYYSAEYAKSARHIDGGEWEAAVGASGELFFPYVKRRVPGHPELYDLVSPYGYSSVLAPGSRERREFVSQFRKASRERGLVAEFLRGHPFDLGDPKEAGLDVDVVRRHRTFEVDLGQHGIDGYWTGAEGRHRTAVRKAERSGVVVKEVSSSELHSQSGAFRVLYDETMMRVGSASRLRLHDAYYDDLVTALPGCVRLLEARQEGVPVASAIFLVWGTRVHYHLSGSTDAGMRIGATNAVLDHAIRHLLPDGGRLHLGGGLSQGDGLERFKRSLATSTTTVHLCSTVVDRERYDSLVREAAVDPDTEYFPAYRA